MKMKWKRALTILLAVAVLVSATPTSVSAFSLGSFFGRGGWTYTPPTKPVKPTPTPTATPTPTEAPAPEEEPDPTETPAPGEEPAPTETPSPAEEPVPTEEPVPEVTEAPEEPVITPEEPGEEEAPEVSYPAQELWIQDTNLGLSVSVDAPEGALPEGTEIKLTALTADELAAVEEAVGSAVLVAADISFHVDEEEIEPLVPIKVTLTSDEITGIATPVVMHVDDEMKAEEIRGIQTVSENAIAFEAADFSIYAVVEENENARMTVRFHKANSEDTNDILVKKSDKDNLDSLVYDPGVGELAANQVFRGWTTDKDYTADSKNMTIQEVRALVAEKLDDGIGADLSTTIDLYPMIFIAYHVTYLDENSASLGMDTLLLTSASESASYTIEKTYSSAKQGMGFVGWLDESKKSYPVGTTLTLSEDLVLHPDVREGHWLYFDENDGGSGGGASYTPPVFVADGETPARPTDPTRPGYTFAGWYTAASGGSTFGFGTLSKDTTIYAQWTANENSKYTVIIWKQKVTDDKNAADADKTYDFAEMYEVTAASGTTITASMLSAYTGKKYEETSSGKTNTQFMYRAYDIVDGKGRATSVVGGKGDTIVNVYFDRALYTIEFYTSSAISTLDSSVGEGGKMTGLYGQPLSMYGYSWPSTQRWNSVAFLAAFSGTLFGGKNTGNAANKILTYKVSGSDTTIIFYTEDLDNEGSYSEAGRVVYTVNTGGKTGAFKITDRFTGMKPSGYTWAGTETKPTSWTSVTSSTTHTSSKPSRNSDYLHIKYDRVKSDLVYMYNGTPVKTISGIPYEKSLTSYESEAPTVSPDDGYHFDGWYEDPTLTTEFDWDTQMGTDGKIVYAKVAADRFRIVAEPNGGTLPETQSASFLVDYQTVLESGGFEAATRDGYSLIGWYTDEACTVPYNFATRITSATATAYTEEENPDVVGKVTLYAKWSKIIDGAKGINVEYDAVEGEGENAPNDSMLYTDYAAAIAGAASTATDDTMMFAYWSIQKWNGTSYVDSGETVFPGDNFEVKLDYAKSEDITSSDPNVTKKYTVLLKAVYTSLESGEMTTIKFNANGGEFAEDTETEFNLEVNQSMVALAATAVSKNGGRGYIFKEWNTMADGTGVAFAAGATIAADNKDLENNPKINTLYAIWEEVFYIYHSADNTFESVAKGTTTDRTNFTTGYKDGYTTYYYGGYAVYAKGLADADGITFENGTATGTIDNSFWTRISAAKNANAWDTADTGAVYYLKEVSTKYLAKPKAVTIKKGTEITGITFLSVTDTSIYRAGGIKIGSTDTKGVFAQKFTLTQNNGKSVTETAESLFDGLEGYLTVVDGGNSAGDYTCQAYWTTYDSVTVYGIQKNVNDITIE